MAKDFFGVPEDEGWPKIDAHGLAEEGKLGEIAKQGVRGQPETISSTHRS
jgi:hypothetical protein